MLSKAKDYDKGLAGGYNGTFPLTAATKGNIYLLPATKKYYICIKDYSGSQLSAPNSNFEELSVYANRSKLDNLKTFSIYKGNHYIPTTPINEIIGKVSSIPADKQIICFFFTESNASQVISFTSPYLAGKIHYGLLNTKGGVHRIAIQIDIQGNIIIKEYDRVAIHLMEIILINL